MDSEFWEFEPLVGDFQSPYTLLLHLNVFTALSLFRVRGTRPDFRIPPTSRLSCFSGDFECCGITNETIKCLCRGIVFW
jgi:hypothetical protein